MDLIEIGVDQFTDANLFEKLATEVLYNEGYYDIKPMPGGNDFGQDAIEDKFYELNEGSKRTIFQYSLQEKPKGKIIKTIKRIKECKIDFEELIYVTNRHISGEVQQELKKEMRINHKVKIDFFERSTIINRLAKQENNLFNRYFPNIEKQVETLKDCKPILTDDHAKSLESSILKSAIAFTFNNDINKTRKSVFDNLILGLLYEKDNLTLDLLTEYYKENLDKNFNNPSQIRSSVVRLEKEELISIKESLHSITKKGRRYIETINCKVNSKTEELLEDVLDSVKDLYKNALSTQESLRIKKNTKEIFVEVFKLFGMELANKFLDDELQSSFEIENKEFLINKAKNNLPEGIADILITVIAEVLRSPSKDQAKILSSWIKAYLGTKIMNLDPSLSEFSENSISKKSFFIDTDFLLNCIIKELPTSQAYSNLIKKLITLGATVYITKDVFKETMKHASISSRTYNHFGKALDSLNDSLADTTIFNSFVRGFYYFKKYKSSNFQEYLGNYYEESLGEDYFKAVIYNALPDEVQIIDIKSLNVTIPKELKQSFKDALLRRLETSKKAKYRNEDQTSELIETDAQLFLTCYISNQNNHRKNVVFGGNYYLITDSLKYLKTALEIKIRDTVTTKPLILEGIFELTGKSSLSDMDYVRLMDNSFLMYAIEGCIKDVLFLVKSGIKLNNKSLPKLKVDLNEKLHQSISEFERIKNTPEEERSKIEDFEEVELASFNKYITKMKEEGYSTIPEVDHFMQVLETKEKENETLKEELEQTKQNFDVLSEELEKFGKRRQNYLKRIKK